MILNKLYMERKIKGDFYFITLIIMLALIFQANKLF